jgi:hypothetical protein
MSAALIDHYGLHAAYVQCVSSGSMNSHRQLASEQAAEMCVMLMTQASRLRSRKVEFSMAGYKIAEYNNQT